MMDRHYQIDKWIPDGSKILDLGCGDGSFLKDLSEKKEITGFGVENDFEKINLCIKNGVSVLHHDIDDGVKEFSGMDFDITITHFRPGPSLRATLNRLGVIVGLLGGAVLMLTWPVLGSCCACLESFIGRGPSWVILSGVF